MNIRPLTIDDMESLAKLYFEFWNETSNVEKMKQAFSSLQNNSAYIFLCAVVDGQLVGSVMGIVCHELYGQCTPFLVVEDMIVDKKYRKKGIGRALFQALEKQAVARGCTQVILVTENVRTDACGFYESIGFHPSKNKGYKKKL